MATDRSGTLQTRDGLTLHLTTDLGSVRIVALEPGAPPVVRYTVHIETDARLPRRQAQQQTARKPNGISAEAAEPRHTRPPVLNFLAAVVEAQAKRRETSSPGSSITVERYNIVSSGRDVKLSLTQGLLRAQVSSVTGPSTFDVSTAAGTASVGSASADWFIRTQTGLAQAGVLAGKIDLTSTATGESVSIPARWGTRLEAGRNPVPPRNWTQAEFEEVTHSTQ